jgi:nucleotide-binding universal stress UspA family protein
MTPEHPVIVAGYDGTRAARAAVVRGAERVRDGGVLLILRAYRLPPDDDPYGAFHGPRLEDAANLAAQSIDEFAEEEPRLAFVRWERHVADAPAAEALVRLAARRDADEIVVGTRGLQRSGLGSVAAEVLERADRPVTVIRERMLVEQFS